MQLPIFSDGSRVGYDLLQVDVNESIYCCFVLGKARLTQIQEIAIPKLELSGAVISVQLRQTIKE